MKKLIAVICLIAMLTMSAFAEELVGQTMPEFTAPITDGGEISLSGLLEEKDLVVLNLFATWCGFCEREFPEMEEVYEKLSDRMEIVALSGYPKDSLEILAEYKASHGLTFPIGQASDELMDTVKIEGFPGTLFIDRSGAVRYFADGMIPNGQVFEDLCTIFMDPDKADVKPVQYMVVVANQEDMGVGGVRIAVTHGEETFDITTNSLGIAAFLAEEPGEYSVQVAEVPEGCSFEAEAQTIPDDPGYAVLYITQD